MWLRLTRDGNGKTVWVNMDYVMRIEMHTLGARLHLENGTIDVQEQPEVICELVEAKSVGVR